MKNVKNWLVNTCERRGRRLINILLIFITLIYIIYATANLMNKNIVLLDTLIEEKFLHFLTSNAGNLISLSAIFLGIYFTIFTLISTLNINSSIANLSEKKYRNIVYSIRNGFVATFIYVLFLLCFNAIEAPKNVDFKYSFLIYINLLICTYILAMAFYTAVLLYAAYERDITNFSKHRDGERIKKINDEEFQIDVKNFIYETKNKLLEIQKTLNKKP